jgi:hypothetical protein
MASGMRSSVKSKYESYRKILEKKAEEVRSSMSAQKAAQVLAREEHPHDEGDLSQQSHEEWIFLNRNTLDIKLLREVQDALRRLEQGSLRRLLRVRRADLRQAVWTRCLGPSSACPARNASRSGAESGE